MATPPNKLSAGSLVRLAAGPDGDRPLYARVKAVLFERIRVGTWKPGQLIPSEMEIARQLGVSQGTARKAIDSLAREQLVVRRQGKGTFVVEHTPDDVLFRFFHIYDEDGGRIRPDSVATKARVVEANEVTRGKLGLAKGEHVIRVHRLRVRQGRAFIDETIVLPRARFPGLAERADIPNTLYDLFQREYGILVARADERLMAVAADARTARALDLAMGTPLLRIERVAYAMDDRPIEWRVSLVRLEGAHYLARLD